MFGPFVKVSILILLPLLKQNKNWWSLYSDCVLLFFKAVYFRLVKIMIWSIIFFLILFQMFRPDLYASAALAPMTSLLLCLRYCALSLLLFSLSLSLSFFCASHWIDFCFTLLFSVLSNLKFHFPLSFHLTLFLFLFRASRWAPRVHRRAPHVPAWRAFWSRTEVGSRRCRPRAKEWEESSGIGYFNL